MLRLSLRQRLYVLTALALAPALAILVYNEFAIRQARQQEIHHTAYRVGELASLEMQRIMTGAEGVLMAIAQAPVVSSGNIAACASYLATVAAQSPQFSSISVVDATGLLVCRSEMPSGDVHIRDRDYFREVMATGRFAVGEYVIGLVSGQPTLPLAVPMRDRGGAVQGVVVGALNLTWLNARIEERRFGVSDALTIADRNGTIIARHPQPDRFVGTRIPPAFQHLVTAAAAGTLEVVSQDGTRRIIGYFPATLPPIGLYVSVGISFEHEMRSVNKASGRGFLIVILGAVVAFLLTAVTARQLIGKPVRRLITTVDGWRAGDTAARTQMQAANGEIEQVGAAIDAYMDELGRARLERQTAEEHRKLLTRELEHRVKNTLAMVQAVARQTLREHVSPEVLQRFSARLTAMDAAYVQLREDQWQGAGLRDVILVALQLFAPERFQIDGPPLRIHARAALSLSMAIHELATNASKYGSLSVAAGQVEIRWSVAGGRLSWTWTERHGPAVTPPVRTGFGTRLLERVLAADLRGTVTVCYRPDGLVCRLETDIDSVQEI